MTKQGLLRILIHQARSNGFEFGRWFQTKVDPAPKTLDEAVKMLAHGRHYYALLFSHEFASCFWKSGAKMSFIVPATSYLKHDQQGRLVTITRKAYTRRTTKADAWKYHLREMAVHDEPLRYIRRFLIMEEDLEEANSLALPEAPLQQPKKKTKLDEHPDVRQLPTTSLIQ